MDEAMPFVERKVETDCVCHRTKKGKVKLCFFHAWQEQRVRQAVRRRFTNDAGVEQPF